MCSYNGDLVEWVTAVRDLFPDGDSVAARFATYAADSDRGEVEDMLDAVTDLSDLVEPHLNTFSSTSIEVRREFDHRAIWVMCRTFRPVLAAALLIQGARQVNMPSMPGSTYVGELAIDLVASVTGQPQNRFLHAIIERAQESDPALWKDLGTMLDQLESTTCNWSCWPSSELAGRIRVQLGEIAPGWQNACAAERIAWPREVRRDLAFRRAQLWHGLLVRVVDCLASPRGDLRLGLEYGLGVLNLCCDKGPQTEDATRSIAELAVLEVFTSVDGTIGCPSARLETGDQNRRKRVQRARLGVLSGWPGSIDSGQWQDHILPQLEEFSGRPEMHFA